MASPKIPATLEGEMLLRAQQGHSSEAIAEWLREAHGIDVTRRTVSRRVAERAADRAAATKGTVREKLAGEAMSDLDVLQKVRDDALALAAELRAEDPRAAIQAMRAASDAADKRLHYAGADAEGEERVPEALLDLLEAAATPEGAT